MKSHRLRRSVGMSLALAAGAVGAPGCLEVIDILRGVAPQPTPGGSGSGGGGLPGDGGNAAPVVQLSASNPAPRPNEEVLLTCRLTQGDATNATFSFQGGANRLAIDARRGTARFLVDASDIGVAFTFTCSATTPEGTSDRSNEQVIIPNQ